jgi:ribosome-associated protein
MIVNPEKVRFKAVRAGGPGGQRTNRRSTKVQLWIKIANLPLTDLEKKRIRAKLAKHVNHKDELEVMADEERSQEMNRDAALRRMNILIKEALKVPKKRIPTEPKRSVEEKRIRIKKMISEKKKARRSIW